MENFGRVKVVQKTLPALATECLKIDKKPNFHNDDLIDASIVFSTVLMDKLYDLAKSDGLDFEAMGLMGESFGNDFRKLIKTYTGLDTHKLAKNYGE